MPEFAAVAEDLLDAPRLVVEAQHDLVDLGHLLEQIELVVEERPLEDRNDRLRRVNRQRTQPRALAAGQENRLHVTGAASAPHGHSTRTAARLAALRRAKADVIMCVPAHMNLPNALTLTRIFLVPLLVVVLLTKFEERIVFGWRKELVGAAIFALASLTDWLDGYLARRRKQVTPLGQVIDPLADKLLTSAAFLSLVQMGLAPAWMVAIIIGREFAVTGLRNLAYSRGIAMPASPLGKIKMVGQVVDDPRADPRRRLLAGAPDHRAGGPVGGRRDRAGLRGRLFRPLQPLAQSSVTDISVARDRRKAG